MLPVLMILLMKVLLLNSIAKPMPEVDSKLLSEIREIYYAGVEDDHYVDTLQTVIYENFGRDTDNYPVKILAYYAGLDALKSKHAFWPFSKMNYLSSSMDIFAKAIEKAPESLEIRFMRFSILHYVPGILGYGNEKEEDLKVIYNLLLSKNNIELDYDIQEGIAQFLIESGRLVDEQVQTLKNRFMIAKKNE